MITGLSIHNQINKKVEKKEQNVQAFVRVRPFSQLELHQGFTSVPIQVSETNKEILCEYKGTTRQYKFDHVFGLDSIQSEVFNTAVKPICDEVLLGFNGTIFVYGQTGTGKTHTMEGRMDQAEQNGIIPRTIDYIFQCLEKAGSDYNIRASHLEIYKEEIFDLLACNGDTASKPLGLFDTQKGFKIPDLEEIVVNDRHTILNILTKSCKRRQTAETMYNKQSSRSHCIFSITVHVKETTMNGEDLIKIGKLNLVDLAGSENAEKSGNNDRLREAALINKSLLTLGKVITDLSNNEKHIPYRSSQLTKILQDSLGGKTKTSIIATISPSQFNLEETVNTLEYALKAKSIKNTPQINQRMSKNSLLKEQSAEIARLKQLLQAAYDKNGVYLTNDMYDAMRRELEEKTEQINKSEFSIQAARHEISSMRKTFDEQTMLLEESMVQLDNSKKQNQEFKRIVEQLISHDSTLRGNLGNAQLDLDKLYDKLDSFKSTEQENHQQINQSKEYLEYHLNELYKSLQNNVTNQQAQFMEKINQQLLDVSDSHSKSNQLLFKKVQVVVQLLENSQNHIQEISKQSNDSSQPLLKLNKDCNDVFTRIDKLILNLRDNIKVLLNDFSPISFQSNTDHQQSIIANCLKLLNDHTNRTKENAQQQGLAIQRFSESMSKWLQQQNQFIEQQKKFHLTFQEKLVQNKQVMEQKLMSKIGQVVSQFSQGYIESFGSFQQTMINNFEHLNKQTSQFDEDSKRSVMDLSSSVLHSTTLSTQLSQEISSCFTTGSNQSEQEIQSNLKVIENIESTKKKIESITDNCVELCTKQKSYFNQFNDKFTDFTQELYQQKDVLNKIKQQKQHTSEILPLIEKSKDQFKNNMDIINKSLEINKLNIQKSTNECNNHLNSLIKSIPKLIDPKVTNKTGQTPFKKQFEIPSPISNYSLNSNNNNNNNNNNSNNSNSNNNKENNNPLLKSQNGNNNNVFDGSKSFGSSFLGNNSSGLTPMKLETPSKFLPQTPKSVKKSNTTTMAPVTPKSSQKQQQLLFNTNQNSVSKLKLSEELLKSQKQQQQQQPDDQPNPLAQSKGIKKSNPSSSSITSSGSSITSSSGSLTSGSSSTISKVSNLYESPFASPKIGKKQQPTPPIINNNSNTIPSTTTSTVLPPLPPLSQQQQINFSALNQPQPVSTLLFNGTPNNQNNFITNLNSTLNSSIDFNLDDLDDDDSSSDDGMNSRTSSTRRKPKIPLSRANTKGNTSLSSISSKKVALTPVRKPSSSSKKSKSSTTVTQAINSKKKLISTGSAIIKK